MPPVKPEIYDEKKAVYSFVKLNCQVFQKQFFINEATKFKDLFKNIVENWTSDGLCNKIISSAILKQALLEIIQHQQGEKFNAIFKRIEEYIEENYDKNINNISIAKELSYHPNYLNSVVKGATGHSLRQYIIDVRIRKASKMLSKGMSVADVAEHTGFYDASHLCVCFKKYYGIPPSQYPRAVL